MKLTEARLVQIKKKKHLQMCLSENRISVGLQSYTLKLEGKTLKMLLNIYQYLIIGMDV